MTQNTMLDLSRWQWAVTAAMHITFPALTVGTSMFLVVCYAMYMRTDNAVWLSMFRFWRRIFGIGFALGVVSGIVMTFEFGLNWGGFAHDVGPILGVIIAMEVVSAFFLEAGFLGLLVYGDGRIGKRMMLFSSCMVSLGTLLSVTWILVANSWMQTPAGYKRVNGQFQPTNWVHVIFDPSFGIRFIHMLVGVLIAAAWFIGGISAWYMLKRRHLPLAHRGLSITLGVLAVLVPLQMYIGDAVAGNYVAKYKPAEIEAMEGNWTSTNKGYNILEIPQPSHERNAWQVTIPWLGSAISKDLTGHTATPGLDNTPEALRPMMVPSFYGFRLMFFGSLLMLAAAFMGTVLRLRGRLYEDRWFHGMFVVMAPIGVLADAGRQPWIVFGKLLTGQAVSHLKPAEVLTSLALFVGLYLILLATYLWYVVRTVRLGPERVDDDPMPTHVPGLQPTPGLIAAGTTR